MNLLVNSGRSIVREFGEIKNMPLSTRKRGEKQPTVEGKLTRSMRKKAKAPNTNKNDAENSNDNGKEPLGTSVISVSTAVCDSASQQKVDYERIIEQLRKEKEGLKRENDALKAEKDEQVPVSSLKSGKLSSTNSTLTTTTVHGTHKIKLPKNVEQQIFNNMKHYVRQNIFKNMKFSIEEDNCNHRVCLQAVQEKSVSRTKEFETDEDFVKYLEESVLLKVLSTLRHNTQSLARRNWIRKCKSNTLSERLVECHGLTTLTISILFVGTDYRGQEARRRCPRYVSGVSFD